MNKSFLPFCLAVCVLFLSSSALSADKSMLFAGCESEAYKIIGVQTNQVATQDYLDKKFEAIRVCMVRQGFNVNRDYFYASAVEVADTMRGYSSPKQSVSEAQRNDYEQELKMRLTLRRLKPDFWQ